MDDDDLPGDAGFDPGGDAPRQRVYEQPEKRHLGRALLFSILENPLLYCAGAGALIIGLGIVGYLAHGWIDDNYREDMKNTLTIVADNSAKTCGLDDKERKQDLFATIYGDVENSSGTSLLNKIPFIGGWMPSLEWLPNKRVYDTVSAVNNGNISLYPSTLSDKFTREVSAVIYNDGSAPVPVLAYNGVKNNELGLLMEIVEEQRGLKPGALALVWNDKINTFETVQFAIGQKQSSITGFKDVILPENPCYEERSLTGRATDAAGKVIEDTTDAVTGTARDVKKGVEDKARSATQRARDLIPDWFGGDEPEQPATPESAAPAPEPAPEVTVPAVEPAPAEQQDGGGWRSWVPEKPGWMP